MLILFQIYLIYAKTFIQVVRAPTYISTILSAAAGEGPDEMTCLFTLFYHMTSRLGVK